MIDDSTIEYVFKYYSHLMNEKEKLANRHIMSTFKLKDVENENLVKAHYKAGFLTNDLEALNLITNGFNDFRIKTVERILREYPNEIHFNNCPNCKRLARTPNAKQCRYCNYSWHFEK